MTAPEIRQLDEQTVERIAAGEVVERPASGVKELVENSLDADASRVTVAVEGGGAESIRVTDDGVGMDEETLRRSVEKHTTSKIRDIDDLEGGLGTLGFRGEALHAIGAVSRVTLRSRPRGGVGTELTVEGGEVTDCTPAGCPEGTTVEVQDLFYNVPARRKYLKTESTEFSHISTVVTNYALANPDVSVTLEHDGRETFATTGSGDLRETVLSVYGREVAESMLPVSAADGPLSDISGLVSHPETNRASREYLSTFVNGRYVTASTVREAVVDAYDGQLASDRYPFAVLFLEVDPATVDVNVHPRKLEVRFADDEGVRGQVREAVEAGLLEAGLVRSSAPRGQSAPEQTEIQPGEGPETDSADTATDEGSGTDDPGSASADRARSVADESRTDDPGSASADRTGSVADEESGADGTTPADATTDSGLVAGSGDETAGPDDERTVGQSSTARAPGPGPSPASDGTGAEGVSDPAGFGGQSGDGDIGGPEGSTAAGTETADGPTGSGDGGETVEPARERSRQERKFRGGQQARLGGGEADMSFEQLPGMRVLGQFRDTYVVAETADGLVLVDQHAADERINYERLRESVAGGTTTQALAEPVRLEVTAREAELFEANDQALARLGFHASLVEDRIVEVSTVPALVAETAGPELVRDVLGEFVEGDVAAAETVEAAVDELLADLACYPSITGNTSLTEGSVVDLLDTLDECENPYACPHGRPVVVELDDEEIEARFERDYPGH
ncbi:MAG: DNA mismatch repair protein MutL [halophilic archaeon J07HX64]|jgi:DNA mismatch repair protein MutL|nr:MAG: DNA mismatch repair protein MutL [halophilic archaeon J07HX64]